MEIEDYSKSIVRHRGLIITLGLIAGIIAAGWVALMPVRYDVSVAFTIRRANAPAVDEYQYDDYYSLQASDYVAQTVVSWFATPSIVVDIYRSAGFDAPTGSLEQLARRFQPRKYAAQNVVIKFDDESRSVAEKLAGAIGENIAQRVSKLALTTEKQSSFEALAEPVVIRERQPNWLMAGLVGLVAGVIIGVFMAAIVEGAKREPID